MSVILSHQFASSSSGLGALGVNGSAFIIQLITFVLAYIVLRRYAFGPILKVMQARRDKIESGVSLAEKMEQEKAALDKRVTAAVQAARLEADRIVADAQEAGRAIQKEAEEKARVKADLLLSAAKQRSEQDAASLRSALEAEVVGLIADVTSTVLAEKVDNAKDRELIERVVKEQQRA